MAQALVIDDEEAILKILRTLLVKLDFEVKVARDGREGIELFGDGHDFDLVITDMRMPRVDGNQVAKHIRGSDKPDTPISAFSTKEGHFQIGCSFVQAKGKKTGPPSHAKAHVYRAKHTYRYYHSANAYYDVERKAGFYLEGNNWHMGVSLPDRSERLKVDHSRPRV